MGMGDHQVVERDVCACGQGGPNRVLLFVREPHEVELDPDEACGGGILNRLKDEDVSQKGTMNPRCPIVTRGAPHPMVDADGWRDAPTCVAYPYQACRCSFVYGRNGLTPV